jgi:hypothetical protein
MPHHRNAHGTSAARTTPPRQATTPHVGSHGALRKALPRAAYGMATSDVESSSRLDFLLLHNLRRRFVA